MTLAGWRIGARRSATSLLALTLAFLAALALPVAASAHALLQASQPAAGATVGSAPSFVLLTFGETPDLRLTTVKVLDSGGRDHVAGKLQATDDPRDSIRVPIDVLPDGPYTVAWRTVSAIDGHLSAGSFSFGVGVPAPTGAPDQGSGGAGQEGTPPAIGARWLLYLGLVALLGAAFVALAVARRPAPDLLAMAALGWLLAVIGSIGVVVVQWAQTGAPLEQLPGTSIGVSALARLLALGLVGISLAVLALVPRLAATARWVLVTLAASLAFVADVAFGHAGAGAGWLVQVSVQTVHAVAASAWVGGLAALLVVLRTTPAGERLATARRFSAWAGWALVAVAISGAVRALQEVGTVGALFGTDFGRVVIGKSVVLAGLASLGAFNRFVTLRNAERLTARLRRLGGLEIALAVVVLGLSGWLVNLTPPTSAGAPAQPVAQPIVATGHDFGTSIRLRLVVSPGSPGSNEFDAALTDYDSGEPVDAARLALRFELASQPGVGASTLELEPVTSGHFKATGANLSIDGIWRITATVAGPAGGVEIPLVAATTVPPQSVQLIESPDVPTIHAVQLGAIGSAQVYLDPEAPGPNELHVTFFDPAGTAEIPIETATITAGPAGEGAAILEPRLLEPGHFVASIEAGTGALAIDAVAPLPDGTGQVHLRVTIEVQP